MNEENKRHVEILRKLKDEISKETKTPWHYKHELKH